MSGDRVMIILEVILRRTDHVLININNSYEGDEQWTQATELFPYY